jgi:hypothetical protein
LRRITVLQRSETGILIVVFAERKGLDETFRPA